MLREEASVKSLLCSSNDSGDEVESKEHGYRQHHV